MPAGAWPRLELLRLDCGHVAGLIRKYGPILGGVRDLGLGFLLADEDDFERLADLAPAVRRLTLDYVTGPHAARLAALPGLESLDLAGMLEAPPPKLTPGHVRALARSASGPNLKALRLGRLKNHKVADAA